MLEVLANILASLSTAAASEGSARTISHTFFMRNTKLFYEYYFDKMVYLEALPKLISPTTNRLHTTFNQTVTATGRISCTDPNLQNIPIRTEEGRLIRKMFVPTK